MYKVLLVDDEPIIISGIQSMLDWGTLGCSIAGISRNGAQALADMEKLKPDIVICDISLPGLSGLEVLKRAAEEYPRSVFIMLTNYQKFDMAQESLRYKAVDYLLKSSLDSETFKNSVLTAIKECERRKTIEKVSFVENYIETNITELISENISQLLFAQEPGAENSFLMIDNHDVFSCYCLIKIYIDASTVFEEKNFSSDEETRLLAYEQELISQLSQKLLPHFVTLGDSKNRSSSLLYVWGLPEKEGKAQIRRFYTKLLSSLENITQATTKMISTSVFSGNQFHICRSQFYELEDEYYINPAGLLFYEDVTERAYRPLSSSSIIKKIMREINNKNAPAFLALTRQAEDIILGTVHRRAAGIKFCSEIYTVLSAELEENGIGKPPDTIDYKEKLDECSTRDMLVSWLRSFCSMISSQMLNIKTSKPNFVEEAAKYVDEHITEHIMLYDVANSIGISSNYLSALFKKNLNQNFMDYVNMKKMDLACKMIRERKHLIYEISHMLGFENAYYFTKVFKRYIGRTPSEYQAGLDKH